MSIMVENEDYEAVEELNRRRLGLNKSKL